MPTSGLGPEYMSPGSKSSSFWEGQGSQALVRTEFRYTMGMWVLVMTIPGCSPSLPPSFLFFPFCVCVCSYVCTHSCTYVYGGQSQPSGPFLRMPSTYPKTGSLSGMELADSARLVSPQDPQASATTPGFFIWVLGLGVNAGPNACKRNASLMKSYTALCLQVSLPPGYARVTASFLPCLSDPPTTMPQFLL